MNSDLISRQAAVERFDYIRPRDPMTSDYTHGIDVGIALCKVAIREQPPAQFSTNLAEVGTDLISRQMLLEYIHGEPVGRLLCDKYNLDGLIEQMPSAQPEIIRCKDCKYARLTNDGSCKYCDIWFPDEAEYMDGDYYCASAERKSNG